EIEDDDGKNPPAPGSINGDNASISWSGATGNHIVGYRIYHAKKDGGPTKLIGHTTDSSYTLPDTDGEYYVKAVNYFGKESDLSKPVTIDVKKDDKEKKEDKKKNKEKDKKKKKEEDNKKKKDKGKDKNKKKEDDDSKDGN